MRRCLVRAMYLSASAVGRAYKGARYNKCSTFTDTVVTCLKLSTSQRIDSQAFTVRIRASSYPATRLPHHQRDVE